MGNEETVGKSAGVEMNTRWYFRGSADALLPLRGPWGSAGAVRGEESKGDALRHVERAVGTEGPRQWPAQGIRIRSVLLRAGGAPWIITAERLDRWV